MTASISRCSILATCGLRSLHEFNSNGLTDPDFHVPGGRNPHPLRALAGQADPAAVSPLARALPRLGQGELQPVAGGAGAPCWRGCRGLVGEWSAALASDEALAANWWRDMYRSHRLDILDDLSGRLRPAHPAPPRLAGAGGTGSTSRPWWTIWPLTKRGSVSRVAATAGRVARADPGQSAAHPGYPGHQLMVEEE